MRSFANTRDRILSLEDIQHVAPSVFAQEPWERMSDNYRFIPTIDVVKGLIDNGFQPVSAKQSRTRIEGKQDFTKHILRFRHADAHNAIQEFRQRNTDLANAPEVPEIVLLNSHDGGSSYQISLGIFRLICLNGLLVSSGMTQDIKVRHSGHEDIVGQVIEGSYKIIEDAPKHVAQIEDWKRLTLDTKEQEIMAEAALEVRGTTLDISPDSLLSARRYGDDGVNGRRDLWRTMNTIQENLVRGGVSGRNSNGQRRRLRGVNSVDADTKLNRALWQMAEKMAELKQ